jgi:hypothetical protein
MRSWQFVFNEMQINEYDITNELGEREYRFDGQQLLILSKMAAITKNRNFFKWPKLLYFKPESAQI